MKRLLLVTLLWLRVSTVPAAETFGNFHTLGIELELPSSLSQNHVGQVRLHAQWNDQATVARSGAIA